MYLRLLLPRRAQVVSTLLLSIGAKVRATADLARVGIKTGDAGVVTRADTGFSFVVVWESDARALRVVTHPWWHHEQAFVEVVP